MELDTLPQLTRLLAQQLETGTAAPTRPSQVPLTIQAILPASTIQGSAQYRSAADPTLKQRPRIQLVDTPGHPKLRSDALSHLLPSSSSGKKPTKLPQVDGVLFVADGTGLNSGDLGLSDAGEFLHDVLLALQRRYERAKSSRTNEIPVLIIASKDDLFTAAPAGLAKKALEKEVARVRAAKARGLMQVEEGDNPGDESALGGWQEGDGDDFTFGVMAEYGVKVDVVGCNVRDAENGVSRCWGWIGQSL